MTLNPVRKARLVGVVILLVLVFAYLELRPAIVTLTATEVRGDIALWLYGNDLKPGDRFRARVWTDDGLSREEVQGVRVQTSGSSYPARYTPGERDNDLDFDIDVPFAASGELEVVIDVASSSGGESFRYTLDVHSPTTSWLRRGVKFLLAFASWIILMLADTARRRWYVRRHRRPSRAWLLALVPVAAVGWFWFAELIEHATRLYGWLPATPALGVWLLALRISARTPRSRYAGMKSYVVEQVMMESPGGDAFRGARTAVPMQSFAELELAWIAAGFEVDRVGNDVRLLLAKRGTAMISMPPSGILGGGEPFGLQASDDDIATLALHAVTPLLGELRAHADGTQLTVSSTEATYR